MKLDLGQGSGKGKADGVVSRRHGGRSDKGKLNTTCIGGVVDHSTMVHGEEKGRRIDFGAVQMVRGGFGLAAEAGQGLHLA